MSAHLIASLGWVLLHFVWQGALIGCAAAILLTVLRNARPETRYAAACGALLLCIAWPAADFVLLMTAGPDGGADGRTLAGVAAAVLAADPAELLIRVQHHLDALVVAWAACAGAFGLRMAAGLVWIGRTTRAGDADPHWQARLSAMAARCGLVRGVRLRVVDALASPVTAGWWRPVVLVPASLLTGMDAPLLEALLAHELGHVKRHDYLVNLAQNVVEALLFYHPAVWWLSRRIRVERERIADDFAAREIGEPRRLALALSKLERLQCSNPRLAQAANGGDLLARIRRLLRPDVQVLHWQAALPVLGLILACAVRAHAPAAPASLPTPAAPDAASADRSAVVDFNSCEKPQYPKAELDAAHTGTVTIAFLVDRTGTVRSTRIARSSGYAGLDEAASSALSRCTFKPARVHGRAVDKLTKVQYVWTLD